jgi:hypothetical protein
VFQDPGMQDTGHGIRIRGTGNEDTGIRGIDS